MVAYVPERLPLVRQVACWPFLFHKKSPVPKRHGAFFIVPMLQRGNDIVQSDGRGNGNNNPHIGLCLDPVRLADIRDEQVAGIGWDDRIVLA